MSMPALSNLVNSTAILWGREREDREESFIPIGGVMLITTFPGHVSCKPGHQARHAFSEARNEDRRGGTSLRINGIDDNMLIQVSGYSVVVIQQR